MRSPTLPKRNRRATSARRLPSRVRLPTRACQPRGAMSGARFRVPPAGRSRPIPGGGVRRSSVFVASLTNEPRQPCVLKAAKPAQVLANCPKWCLFPFTAVGRGGVRTVDKIEESGQPLQTDNSKRYKFSWVGLNKLSTFGRDRQNLVDTPSVVGHRPDSAETHQPRSTVVESSRSRAEFAQL